MKELKIVSFFYDRLLNTETFINNIHGPQEAT